jgi:serine/threonine protein kinase
MVKIIPGEKIGEGSYGKVLIFNCFDEKSGKKIKDTKYAAKLIKNSENKKNLELSNFELNILLQFNNENIIKCFGFHLFNSNTYLLLEYCNGGDLLHIFNSYKKIKKINYLDEKIVQKIIRDILNALSCLSRNSIIHRDLKLSNILVSFKNEEDKIDLNLLDATYKLCDFGLSSFSSDKPAYKAPKGGTMGFLSPSNFCLGQSNKFGNDKGIDIWALGIITAMLLTGENPFITNMNFFARSYQLNLENKGYYTIDLNEKPISFEALCFLDFTLKLNPNDRYISEELEYTRFITRNPDNFTYISKDNYKHILPEKYIDKNKENSIILYANKREKLYDEDINLVNY